MVWIWASILMPTWLHLGPKNQENRCRKGNKIAFNFGVFGLPETFIINKNGEIIYKHTGPLTKKIIEDEIAILF